MPTILKVYSCNMSSPVVRSVINFACRQFLVLHRNPFVLQVRLSESQYTAQLLENKCHRV